MSELLLITILLLGSHDFNPEINSISESNSFNSVIKEDSLLWIGTDVGLIKYDTEKNESIFYTKENSKLPSNSVNSILIDGNGNKWIGTEEGLAKFDNFTWETFLLNKDNPPTIWDLDKDSKGNIWALAFDDGVYKQEGYKFIHFETSEIINSDISIQTDLVIDKYDNVWVSSLSGLIKFKDGNWKLISKPPIPRLNYEDIYEDYTGALWFVQLDSVFRYTKEEGFTNIPYLADKGLEQFIIVDGHSIIASYDDGLIIVKNWTKQPETVYYNPGNSGITSSRIYDAIFTGENIWICTDNGLSKFTGEDWKTYNISKFRFLRKN